LIAVSKVWRYVNTAPMSSSRTCKRCMSTKTEDGDRTRRQSFVGALVAASLFQVIASALGNGWVSSQSARAAASGSRGLLEWSQQELARRAEVGIVTVHHQLEAGTSEPRRATLHAIRRAFELAGVEFIEENGGGPGVRLRKRHQKKS